MDIGFGGDPIVDEAMCLDRYPGHPGRHCGEVCKPTHLVGDAANLLWFRDGVLDYVFSSHVLEDFDDTAAVLVEWCRVLRPGGMLVLFLPDQKTYAKFCEDAGQQSNQAHKHAEFSLEWVRQRLPSNMEVVHAAFPVDYNPYSFEFVAQKQSP